MLLASSSIVELTHWQKLLALEHLACHRSALLEEFLHRVKVVLLQCLRECLKECLHELRLGI